MVSSVLRLLPDVSEEDIRCRLKANGGKGDIVLQELLDAQEASFLGGLLDDESPPPTTGEAAPLQGAHQPQACNPTSPTESMEEANSAPPSAVRLASDQIPEDAETEAEHAEPQTTVIKAPQVPSVPTWLPMLQPSTPVDQSSKRLPQLSCYSRRRNDVYEEPAGICWTCQYACHSGGRSSTIGRRRG